MRPARLDRPGRPAHCLAFTLRPSKDFNPIHISSWAARLLGFRGVVAHGICVTGRALRAVETAAARHAPLPGDFLHDFSLVSHGG